MRLRASDLTRCRHRIRRAAELPPGTLLPREDSGVRQRKQAAEEHRAAVRELVRGALLGAGAGAGGGAAADAWDEGLHVAALAALVERGRTGLLPERVWQVRLPPEPDTLRAGGVELLVRDGTAYIPVIVVNHKVTDPGSGALTSPLGRWEPSSDPRRKVRAQTRDQMRLAHVTRMLERHGLASPARVGGVIGYDADVVLVHRLDGGILDRYDARYADRAAVARGEAASAPARVAECASCPFWGDLTAPDGTVVPGCGTALRRSHDVSLVARGDRTRMLREAGIGNVDRLAAWRGAAPEQWHGGGFGDTVTAARAWLVDEPLVRRTERVVVPRADVEVDVDMECYQEFGAYLWGTLVTDGGVDLGYRPFVTWEPVPTDDEARSFAEFWCRLMTLREDTVAAGRTFAAYCYSQNAENKWMLSSAARFQGYPGIPSVGRVREFIESDQWVDLLDSVTEHFVSPRGRGLKVLARYAGFDWRDADAGGEASMGWYREAVGLDDAGGSVRGGPDGPDGSDGSVPGDGRVFPPDGRSAAARPLSEAAAAQRTRVLEYNEDDVRATKALREWMSDEATDAVPYVGELPVPAEAELRAVESELEAEPGNVSAGSTSPARTAPGRGARCSRR